MKQRPLTQQDFPHDISSLFGDIHHIAYPQQGDTSQVAIVEGTHGQYVVKCSRQLPFTDWLWQEYRVLQALEPSGISIPKTYKFVSRTGSSGPETWLVMAYLPGLSLREVLYTERDGATRHDLLHQFGQVLATIHKTPVPSELSPINQPWLATRLALAEQNLRNYDVDGSQELLEHLQRTQPNPTQQTLIHGDFTIDNTLIKDGKVSGVIDWSGGALGDPRSDIALAIRPKPNAFQSSADLEAFYRGYGQTRLSNEEYRYFVNLYEFF